MVALSTQREAKGAGRGAQVVVHLPGKCEALSSNPSTAKKGKEGELKNRKLFKIKNLFILNILYRLNFKK
jgi:Fe-S cluster biogenesis protein NfuA